MLVSIVTTMYRSAAYVGEFHARAEAVARQLGFEPEFVYVNDGSPDEALQKALELRQQHRNVRVIDLSRNFGHHAAMMIGLAHATGDRIFLIDCDLEEAPELLKPFVAEMDTTGADVVFGVQAQRRGTWLDRLLARAYYQVHNWLCDEHVPENLMTVRLMSRRYVDGLLSHREVNFTIAGLWARTGFVQIPVKVQKGHRRDDAESTYTLVHKLALLVRTVTSFSARPLYVIFILGMIISGLAALAALGLIVARIFVIGMAAGWPSLVISVWLMGGLIIFCQGIIGIYLAQIYLEVKRRPIAVIRQVYE